MKKILISLLCCSLCFAHSLKADEGMWLLPLIEKLNIGDMQKKGLKLNAQDIYSINNTSLKDAIVIFGGGCTGELISDQGLLLTNHHCGYGAIQQHSTVDHDYLRDGFWAKNRSEEIYTPDLKVTFLERIEDVTADIRLQLDKISVEKDRDSIFKLIAKKMTDKVVGKDKGLEAVITSLYGGNMYYLFVYKIYKDIRMVGAPPSSIGKFGADTDNWMWPRHTGDFSLFRVYADENGKPAEYSEQNIPLKPKHHIPISLKGVEENDYAMIMGFPGRTQRYMTSWEIAERMDISNAGRIKIRGIRQKLMMEDMQADQKVRIQYSSKYSGSSNYWKNSIGMNQALDKLKVVDQKRKNEADFNAWANATNDRKQKYSNALELIQKSVEGRAMPLKSNLYISECLIRGSEIVGFANSFIDYHEALGKKRRKKKDIEDFKELETNVKKNSVRFFKDYNMPTDKKISQVMYDLYMEDTDESIQPEIFTEIRKQGTSNFINKLFASSMFIDSTKLYSFLENPTVAALETDPAFAFAQSIKKKTDEFKKDSEEFDDQFSRGFRTYLAGLMEMNEGKAMYPDANFTMRLTYGSVKGYEPKDAVEYQYISSLKGVMAKEDPNNWEFVVPQKLKDLFNTKDFGQYAMKNGDMPVNFIFDADITGGNSGSPVINANGELIGTAFDGNWEAMSGDIAFEHDMQRCINVDIRYTLFIIDKFAGAKHLIDEMTIVK